MLGRELRYLLRDLKYAFLFKSPSDTLFCNYVEGCLENPGNVRACLYLF